MRGARHLICALAAVFALGARTTAAAAAINVSATVDRNQVFVGEPFTLTIDVEGSQQAEPPDVGEVGPFKAAYIGPSTRFSSVNGRVFTSVSHRYALTPTREGTFRLGPFRVRAEGVDYEAAAIDVTVSPRSSAAAGQGGEDGDLRLVITPDKASAFVGERVPFSVELYVGDVAVNNLRFPTIDADGFAVDGFAQPGRREEIVRNRRWSVLKFRSTLTPLRPGPLAIGPTHMALEVIERLRRHGSSMFDDFFSSSRSHPMELSADAVTLDVKPLPAEGRPADFSGAVGQFDFQLEAAPRELAAGDPITVKMEIRGVGNLESVTPPRVPAGVEFRAYDPTLSAGAGPGSLAAEQVLIPRDASVAALPAVSFSFFEPESGAYRTITRGPIALTVRPTAPSPQGRVLDTQVPEGGKVEEKLGRDIVYIKDTAGDLSLRDRRFYTQWWFAVLQLLPVAAVAALAAFMRRRRALSADPRMARYQRAGRVVRKRLSALSSRARDGAFYDELSAAMRGYLADKLDLPPGGVDRANVSARLERAGAAGALREQAARFFDVTEPARYAPGARIGGQNGDPREALELAEALVKGLERERGIARRLGAIGALLLIAGAAVLTAAALHSHAFAQEQALPAAAPAARDLHTIFFEGNAAYKDGDYAGAAREYERLLGAGFESGALHYNLGNAYFKQGKYGRAILAYERARRLSPRDADVKANLAYARESAKSPHQDQPFWQRVVFAPAHTLSTAELAILCTALWWAAWAWLGLRIAGRRGEGVAAGWAVAAALAVLGASLAFRVVRLDGRSDGVVVAPGESVARFEPSPNGKEYFRVGEGAVLDVRRERSGWLQVARDDGLRGWMASDEVEPIAP